MHDLHVERFLKNEAGDGPIKAFTLRGIKDSPPYLHDGRLLTLEDTVEFFNLVLELKLTPEEKHNLVDFMRQLEVVWSSPPAGSSDDRGAWPYFGIGARTGLRESAMGRHPKRRHRGYRQGLP